MTEDTRDEASQPAIKKAPPAAGTVAGRVPAPAVYDKSDDTASPGAAEDERQSKNDLG